ncbi:hypothetical protein SAMN04515647_3714 [Cohaesibacter sp. ES.047]|uniref:hypothetical protein n=1 Tax=Cohaesibacter sp. ES.047 TaxID=1798205 RepID=UPI000BB7EF5B|nr:hypothetical protein [Cohaesibacter sp. ES.047]SNY93419.1 hypothetical protein SAMN04515647_3714 [Cohaesibacter sp. ES.047]
MARSSFGERFATRSKGLAEYFGKPLFFVGVNSDGWSSMSASGADDDPVEVKADLVATQRLDSADLRNMQDGMRIMLANHEFVISIHTDQPGLVRAPHQLDRFYKDEDLEAVAYVVDEILDEGNGWIICGCSMES